MNVCVYGAGAVGSHFAARLIEDGAASVSVVARGLHLEAIRARGLTLRASDRTFSGRPLVATDDPSTLPTQDVVVVTLKAPSVPAQAAALRRLIGEVGFVVFLGNGIPWWWSYGLDESPSTLSRLDPAGELWSTLGPERVVGGVVYSANEIVEPGVVVTRGDNRWVVGEPACGDSDRLELLRRLCAPTTLDLEVSDDIRAAVWQKLVVNASVSGVSALTRLTSDLCASDAGVRQVSIGLMNETLATATALGWDLTSRFDADTVIALFLAARGVRSSMLQDVLRGRPTEVEAILGQVHAFATAAGVETPTMDVVVPLLRGLDRAASESTTMRPRPGERPA